MTSNKVQVLEMQKRTLGDVHPDTLTSMNNLAITYSHQGKFNAAETLQVQVLEMQKRILGDVHPDTLTSMKNLANTYLDQRKLKAAEHLQVQVVEMQKRILGYDHPDTLIGMNNLVNTYLNQGKLNAAETLQVQVLEMLKRMLGDDHPHTLSSMTNLANTYFNQGKLNAAETLQVQVLEVQKRVLGEEHPHTLQSIHSLSRIQNMYTQPHDAVAVAQPDEQSPDVPTAPSFTGPLTQDSNHHYKESPEFSDESPENTEEATGFPQQSTGFFNDAHNFEMNGTNQFADIGGAEDITVNMIGSYDVRTTHNHQETGSATSMAFVAGASIALQVQSMLHPPEQSVRQKPNDSYRHSGPDIVVDTSHLLSTCTLLIMGLRHVLPDAICSKIRKQAGGKYGNVQEIMKDQSGAFNFQVSHEKYEKVTVSLSAGDGEIWSLD